MIKILSICGHSLVLAMTNIVAILVGFGAYHLLKPVNQVAVQVPIAAMVCIIGFVSWIFFTQRLPFKGFVQPSSGELAWVYLAALLWTPLIFVPLHYVSQGYLTSIGNILGIWLFQVPVNLLALLAAYKINKHFDTHSITFRATQDATLERLRRARPAHREHKPSLERRGFLIAALAAVGGLALGWLLPSRQTVTLPDETIDAAQFYHRWSKLGPTLRLGTLLSWGKQPMRYKTYPEAKQIALPDPHGYRGLSLEEAIEQRRSRRDYTAEPLSLTELSCLLRAAGGITAPAQGFRAAPSAGALYPIEIYLVVQHVIGLEAGLYHYAVANHALEQLRVENLRPALVVAGLGQEMLAQAPLCFVLSAIFQRARWKYHQRAYRYILLETGHIGQNLYLTATSLGLGACAAGAFLDDKLNDLLGLDGEAESALYLVAVGRE